MLCLDANALVDYLHGVPAMGDFVQRHDREVLFAPTVALQMAFVGAARTRGEPGVAAVREDLDWLEPIPLTVDGAAEAARIDAELHGAGEPIGAFDTLIAGTVRDAGGAVVTHDDHFERVDELDVVRYDEE